jgi:hypothetical protein
MVTNLAARSQGQPQKYAAFNCVYTWSGSLLSFFTPGIPPDIPIGNTDFQMVLSDLSSADDSIATAVKFAGKVRNTVGHNLGWKAALEKSQR